MTFISCWFISPNEHETIISVWTKPGVNFTNILRAAFLLISLRQTCLNFNYKYRKAVCLTFIQKKLLVKCWWNWHLESISPTFYESNCANFLTPIKSLTFKSKHKKSFLSNFRTEKPRVKCWWNLLLLVSKKTKFSLSKLNIKPLWSSPNAQEH